MKNFTALLIALLFTTMSFAAPGKFDKEHITFSFPDDWNITDQQDFDGNGYYLSCEKEGDDASGLVTISWANSIVDLDETAEEYKSQLLKNYEEQGMTPEFTKPVQAKYGSFQVVKMTYKVNISDILHSGTIYSFHACDKTITIMAQEAVEDTAHNIEGFKLIEQTLKCN